MFIDQVGEIPDAVRDAILIKWLGYVKSENCTEWVMWRKHLMNVKLGKNETTQLKIGLEGGRKKDINMVMYRDKTNKENPDFPKGMCHKDASMYGERINKIFPILDPDLANDDERVEKHKSWFVDAPDNAKFLN